MARRVLGTRERTKDDPTLADQVKKHLDLIAAAGEGITAKQIIGAEEAVDAVDAEAGGSPLFRFATSSELEETAQNLARRLKRGDTPSDSDLNAALVMIMDAEDQRRILFEQREGVRTPDPTTGVSSLDDPRALENLARRTGVGDPSVEGPTFVRNIRALFDLP